ncbi:MAG: hypothetical protein NT007_02115 [Candidatus Kapabacteria bacterium]|nr:hypothetical protein [Candidatus Kapabacteria bacterium]
MKKDMTKFHSFFNEYFPNSTKIFDFLQLWPDSQYFIAIDVFVKSIENDIHLPEFSDMKAKLEAAVDGNQTKFLKNKAKKSLNDIRNQIKILMYKYNTTSKIPCYSFDFKKISEYLNTNSFNTAEKIIYLEEIKEEFRLYREEYATIIYKSFTELFSDEHFFNKGLIPLFSMNQMQKKDLHDSISDLFKQMKPVERTFLEKIESQIEKLNKILDIEKLQPSKDGLVFEWNGSKTDFFEVFFALLEKGTINFDEKMKTIIKLGELFGIEINYPSQHSELKRRYTEGELQGRTNKFLTKLSSTLHKTFK